MTLSAPELRQPGFVLAGLKWLGRFAGLFATAAVVVVAVILWRRAATVLEYNALIHALRAVDSDRLVWSLVATSASFVALIGRDAAALKYVGQRVPWTAIGLAGLCGNALGNAVGFGTLTGGAIRYRIYGAVGMKPDGIARLMLFIAGGFAAGLVASGGLAALVEAPLLASVMHWEEGLIRAGGAACLALTGLLLACCRFKRIRLFRFEVALPGPGLAAMQIVLTGLDLLAASAALWVLLPPGPLDFGAFTAIFIVATALGVISHTPGGIGVFEAVIFLTLGRKASPEAAAAALIAYRLIYFGLPLLISAALMALFELRGLGQGRTASRLSRSVVRLSPVFLAVITFTIGTLLIVSGATPAFGRRLALLSVRVPLWLVEASHFLGSLVGVLLLFIARGLMRRLDGAWWLALTLTILSLGLSLAKGLAYAEAGLLAVLLMLLLATRRQFDRQASLLRQPFTGSWFLALAFILTGCTGILLFAFRDVAYTRDLWWEFEFDATAPRALRAVLGMCILSVLLGLWNLLRSPKGRVSRPEPADLARAGAIARAQDNADALLVLMGDKSLLFSPSGRSFLMFGKRGRSWIALFDPVGAREEWPELIWRFVEMAAEHGGRAAFYQVRAASLPIYLDVGLKIMKLGEEARVDLAAFSLKGSARAHLRYALKRAERDGLDFALLPPADVPVLMPDLARISADWLAGHRASEMGFSVAAFRAGFVAGQHVALVRQEGRPAAFVTVMVTDTKAEATIGVMRHLRDASPYAMEFLFTKLILTLQEDGVGSLSLGMAPLSGLEPHPLSSRWHRIGNLLWRHGGMLYNFQGLRLFKNKFGPHWEPRYLAASGTIAPFVALADVTALAGTAPPEEAGSGGG
jgi:phosphatidylglycerol lysyltransferase